MNLSLAEVAQALGGEVCGQDVLAPGPGHSAEDRSLSVRLDPKAPEGFVVHSFAGDDALQCRDYVRQRLGLPAWQPRQSTVAAPARRQIIAEYIYKQIDGTPYLKVIREEPKSFPQRHWTGTGWGYGKPAGPKIPYRLPELHLATHSTVFIVEGEKDADRLAGHGFVATTSSEGAGKWTADLNQYFRHRTVYIIADNDPAGRTHAYEVAENLRGIAQEVRVAFLPGLPEKGDVSDWLDAGGKPDELEAICRQFPAYSGPAEERPEVDGPDRPPEDTASAPRIIATPFLWCDPTKLPRRQWLYGGHLIRKFVSATVAPGGVGKSSLELVEALAMTSGQPLLDISPAGRLRVWYWCGEDPMDELQRRVMAAATHYQLAEDDLDGRLFINSGRATPIIVAEQNRNGVSIATPVVDAVRATIADNKIDVVIIDPFVSSHRVTENDNNSIDAVAKLWAQIADQTNCAVELVHHVRKTGGGEITVEDGRGASALLNATRSGRTLNVMTTEEAEKAGVENRRLHFRVDSGKSNMAPPPDRSTWYRLASVDLGNGLSIGNSPFDFNCGPSDHVGVVTTWEWPNPLDAVNSAHDLRKAQAAVAAGGPWRENVQSPDWVGYPIAERWVLSWANTASCPRRTARQFVACSASGWRTECSRRTRPMTKTAGKGSLSGLGRRRPTDQRRLLHFRKVEQTGGAAGAKFCSTTTPI